VYINKKNLNKKRVGKIIGTTAVQGLRLYHVRVYSCDSIGIRLQCQWPQAREWVLELSAGLPSIIVSGVSVPLSWAAQGITNPHETANTEGINTRRNSLDEFMFVFFSWPT
jgi:hypothetical protein